MKKILVPIILAVTAALVARKLCTRGNDPSSPLGSWEPSKRRPQS
ncbi:MAG: hypothetical protein R2823_02620 [Acidimicrobiia bacterium]